MFLKMLNYLVCNKYYFKKQNSNNKKLARQMENK